MNESLSLYHSIRKLQIQNSFIESFPATGLSTLETHLLIELQASPNNSAAKLSETLQMLPSSVSRAIAKLRKKGLIATAENDLDKRQKSLIVTSKAEKLLSETDTFANDLLKKLAKPLSKVELGLVVELFKEISDKLNAPDSALRSGEPKYRLEQRRLTRALGLLGPGVFGTNVTPLEWHLLVFLDLSPFPSSTSELASYFGVSDSSISTVLGKFESQSMITRLPGELDKRRTVIKLTSRGHKLVRSIEKSFESLLSKNYAATSTAAILALSLFANGHSLDSKFPFPNELKFKQLPSSELDLERAQVLRMLVESHLESFVGSEIISDDKVCVKISKDETPILFAQFDEDCTTLEFVVAASNVSSNLSYFYLEYASAKLLNLQLSQLNFQWQPWADGQGS